MNVKPELLKVHADILQCVQHFVSLHMTPFESSEHNFFLFSSFGEAVFECRHPITTTGSRRKKALN